MNFLLPVLLCCLLYSSLPSLASGERIHLLFSIDQGFGNGAVAKGDEDHEPRTETPRLKGESEAIDRIPDVSAATHNQAVSTKAAVNPSH